MARLFRRLRYWRRRAQMEAELAEEMEFHRAMLASDGRSARELGNATLAREEARGVWIAPWLEGLWQDAAYALRAMRRSPGFTLTALAALGSAIGLNTSLFAVFNGVALQRWPVRNPAQVVTVSRFTREGGGDFGIAEFRYLAAHTRGFSGLIAMRNGQQVKIGDRPLQLTYVSGNYFRTLGVEMERGRSFLESEDAVAAPAAVAVISHDAWVNRFGGDEGIVGRTVRMDDAPMTIVGVAPADFIGTNPLRNDIWTPLATRKLLRPNDASVDPWLASANVCCTPMAGRLAPGVSRAAAAAELTVLVDQFRSANGLQAERSRIALAGTSWIEAPRKKGQAVAMILTLFIALTLVLLLACANVGNLLLARAAARRQEIAVRLSLGGSRSRLVRQLLVESMLLACLASLLGLGIAFVAGPAILRQLATDEVFRTTPDGNVLAYTIAVAIASCLAFGLAPALHATRGGISSALKDDAEGGELRRRIPLRSALLSVQVAISVILLANAALLVRGIERAKTIDPGYDVAHVTVVSIDLPASQYAGARTQQFTRELESRLAQAGALAPWALTLNPPFSRSKYSTSLRPGGSETLNIYMNEISGGYANAVGMRLLAGRDFVAEDVDRDALLINEAAAKRWWPNEDPLGKTVLANGRMRQIVGVVSDTYANDLSAIEAVIFFPITGHWGAPFIVVRDRGAGSRDRIAAIVKQMEPRAEIQAEPLSASFERQLEPSIYASELAGLLGVIALAIAAVGIAGVFAYVVGQRTREIGVRMALGASPAQIVRLVLGSSAVALACGGVCGFAGAAGISALLVHALPGIEAADPVAYSGVALLLAAVVAIASALPAGRATRIDPVRALRWE